MSSPVPSRIRWRRGAVTAVGRSGHDSLELTVSVPEDGEVRAMAYPSLVGVPQVGDDVLLVGHDPDFSAAVHSLTGAQVRMKKGGLAGVDRGELIVLMRPRELKQLSS